jgi:DNA-binding transcriptional LysR family regulator
VESASTGEILARLRTFDLEAGVVYMESCHAEGLSALPVWEENHVFLTPADRAVGERMTWRQAAELPLCLLTPDMHNRQTIDGVFAELGYQPQVSLETNSILSLLAHVCAGPWSTILPRSVLELIGTPRGVRVLDLEEPAVAWRTGVVTLEREPRSPMVDALLAQARALRAAFERSE